MSYFFVIVSPGVFLTFLSIIIFKKLFKQEVSQVLYRAALISYVVTVTIVCLLGNPASDIYTRINMWSLFMTISSFASICIAIVKYGEKLFFYTSGILTFVYLISIINTIIFQGWEMVFNYYLVAYKATFLIFMVIYIVKKNALAAFIGKILLVVHIMHTITRAAVNSTDVGSAIFEVILFLLISSVIIVPMYILLKKRVLNVGSDNLGENGVEGFKNIKDLKSATQENTLDEIVD